jgi:transposase
VDQSALIELLFAEIKALKERMLVLEKENTFLREKLSKYKNPKNSRNSSVPPSKDENRIPKPRAFENNLTEKLAVKKVMKRGVK